MFYSNNKIYLALKRGCKLPHYLNKDRVLFT